MNTAKLHPLRISYDQQMLGLVLSSLRNSGLTSIKQHVVVNIGFSVWPRFLRLLQKLILLLESSVQKMVLKSYHSRH